MGKHKAFIYGKGIKGDKKKPLKGEPNTNLDVYNKNDGKFLQRRKFGEDGFAVKDLDKGHKSHKAKGDHAHDFIEGHRGEQRELNEKEKREIDKASKKRRFYDD